MSSTSSSDYDNHEYTPYDFLLENCGRAPFTTMGHPLIYFSEAQNPQPPPWIQKPQKIPNRKEHRNCFLNAFKWYSQDRGSNKKGSKDINGFAKWLDSKYSEYLHEIESHSIESQDKSPLTTACCTTPCLASGPGKTKKFPRLRSPWGKRRRTCKEVTVTGAGEDSCQFIMQPKLMDRPASEYCYGSPLDCCDKSKTTPNSTGSSRKCGKSSSLTCLHNNTKNPSHVDVMKQEGSNVDEGKKIDNRSVVLRSEVETQCSCVSKMPVGAGTQYQMPKPNRDTDELRDVDVICKCPLKSELLLKEQNTNTSKISGIVLCECENKLTKKKIRKDDQRPDPSKVLCQCSKANIIESGTPCDKACHNACDRIQQYHPDGSIKVSDGVQTSDHSIHLNRDIASQLSPIYVKIVYADQLKVKQEFVLQH